MSENKVINLHSKSNGMKCRQLMRIAFLELGQFFFFFCQNSLKCIEIEGKKYWINKSKAQHLWLLLGETNIALGVICSVFLSSWNWFFLFSPNELWLWNDFYTIFDSHLTIGNNIQMTKTIEPIHFFREIVTRYLMMDVDRGKKVPQMRLNHWTLNVEMNNSECCRQKYNSALSISYRPTI